MTTFELIGEVEMDDDHPAPYEAIEEVNAVLGGPFRLVSYYARGEGNSPTFYLIKELDDS